MNQHRQGWPIALIVVSGSVFAGATGPLDPGFGSGGRSTVPFDQVNTQHYDVAVGLHSFGAFSDRYLAIGSIDIDHPSPNVVGIGLAKLRTDGALDTTFQTNGKRVKDAGMTSITSSTVAAGFKFLVAGAANADTAVVRFNTDGSDDSSFAGDGGQSYDFSGQGSQDYALTVLTASNGTIWLGGTYTNPAGGQPGNRDGYVATVDSSGGSPVVIQFIDAGSLNDEVRSLAERPQISAGAPLGMLALSDNTNDDFGGRLDLYVQATGTLQWSRTLPKPTGLLSACDADAHDMRSVQVLVHPQDPRRAYVIGNLEGARVQTYVAEFDTVNAQLIRTYCDPAGQTSYAVSGALHPQPDGRLYLHLATTASLNVGYGRWRTVPNFDGSQQPFFPDQTLRAGQPLAVPFAAAPTQTRMGFARSVMVDPFTGQPLVLGYRRWLESSPLSDFDLALIKLEAPDVLFADNLEPDL